MTEKITMAEVDAELKLMEFKRRERLLHIIQKGDSGMAWSKFATTSLFACFVILMVWGQDRSLAIFAVVGFVMFACIQQNNEQALNRRFEALIGLLDLEKSNSVVRKET